MNLVCERLDTARKPLRVREGRIGVWVSCVGLPAYLAACPEGCTIRNVLTSMTESVLTVIHKHV